MFVTAQSQEYDDLVREVSDALSDLGLDVRMVDGALTVDGTRLALNLVDRAHPTPADLSRVVDESVAHHPAMVVADRISEPGREVLRRSGWGWLDRRGHIRVWMVGLRVESPFGAAGVAQRQGKGSGRSGEGGQGGNPWTTVGLEVALAALIRPDQPVQARETARLIGRRPAGPVLPPV